MNYKLSTALLIASTLISTITLAGGPNTQAPTLSSHTAKTTDKGFYIEAALGYGKENVKISTKPSEYGFAASAATGYMITRNIGLEAGFNYLPNIKNYSKNNYAFDIAAKGLLTFNSGFLVFAKFGGALVHNQWTQPVSLDGGATIQGSKTKIALLAGVGLGFHINDNISIIGQGMVITKTSVTSPAIFGTLGVNYHF